MKLNGLLDMCCIYEYKNVELYVAGGGILLLYGCSALCVRLLIIFFLDTAF